MLRIKCDIALRVLDLENGGNSPTDRATTNCGLIFVCSKCVRVHSRIDQRAPLTLLAWRNPMTESLTFTLRQAESDDDVKLACRVRAEAYGRKVASYRDTMLTPDRVDQSPWTTI